MDASKAIEIFERQRERIAGLRPGEMRSAEFKKWKRDTEVALQRVFGDSSRHVADFLAVRYAPSIIPLTGRSDSLFRDSFLKGLNSADAVLASIIDEVKEYDLGEQVMPPDSLALLERIILRFHLVARQLRSRREGRPTLAIEDEYDVQDLLHALLRLHFDDIRAEEWTPSYAGGASRVDFLLKSERIVIEVKKTRSSLSNADLGAQLLADIARYQSHPDCECLICFVYDPEGRVGNPVGLERDLERLSIDIAVRAIVGPKGT